MMLGLPNASRYYLYNQATDLRKSFTGLSGIVNNEIGGKLHSGDGFVFINKRRTMIKILVWDRTGFVIYYKKLASGTFELPQEHEGTKDMEVTLSRLLMILEGIELKSIRWRKRYTPALRA